MGEVIGVKVGSEVGIKVEREVVERTVGESNNICYMNNG